MDLESEKRIQEWLNGPYDQQTKETIRQLLRTNPQELQDAFFTTLSFGTGGLRGLMGVGSNRMNIYTVRMSTQGLANYIKKQPKQRDHHGVVIGYDSRHHSREFAEETARVLAANQIQVYLLPDIRPTPFVSYCVRAKECTSGVMITASHNPKEYNGYKVYWSDGAQVVAPHDQGIIQEVKKIQKPEDVKLVPLNHPLIEILDLSLDNTYLSAIHHLMLNPKENKEHGDGLKIVYTPLHGTGIKLVPRALRDWGFTNVHLVGAQIVPDGNFPTVKSPNPEYPETLAMGIDQLKNSQSDILIATDPDADRMAVAVLHHGNVEILNGNEIASICTEYICSTLEEQKRLPQKGAFVTTIVSTDLIRKIAESYGCLCFETLTGFKYIGEMIHQWEMEKNKSCVFLFGAEESYGFLLGTHARDKDAVIMSCFIAEIALLMKVENKTLVDFLHDIYRKYGVYQETQFTINFPPGKEGIDKINAIMQKIRNHPPREIAGKQVTILEDYQMHTRRELKTGKTEPLTLPTSNVLLFRLSDGSKLIFRPSGTEPKLKVYLGATEKEFKTIAEGIQACSETLKQLLNQAQELIK